MTRCSRQIISSAYLDCQTTQLDAGRGAPITMEKQQNLVGVLAFKPMSLGIMRQANSPGCKPPLLDRDDIALVGARNQKPTALSANAEPPIMTTKTPRRHTASAEAKTSQSHISAPHKQPTCTPTCCHPGPSTARSESPIWSHRLCRS